MQSERMDPFSYCGKRYTNGNRESNPVLLGPFASYVMSYLRSNIFTFVNEGCPPSGLASTL